MAIDEPNDNALVPAAGRELAAGFSSELALRGLELATSLIGRQRTLVFPRESLGRLYISSVDRSRSADACGEVMVLPGEDVVFQCPDKLNALMTALRASVEAAKAAQNIERPLARLREDTGSPETSVGLLEPCEATLKKLNATLDGFEAADLQGLNVSLPCFSNADMPHVTRLRDLRELHLDGCRVSDDGLAHLAELRQLYRLDIGGTAVTDGGLKHLVPLTSLRELSLSANITGAGLARVTEFANLRSLSVERIGDDELEHISHLNHLRELSFGFTDVTDGGLSKLYGLLHLRNLDLSGTEVTASGVEILQQRLPDCVIRWNGSEEVD